MTISADILFLLDHFLDFAIEFWFLAVVFRQGLFPSPLLNFFASLLELFETSFLEAIFELLVWNVLGSFEPGLFLDLFEEFLPTQRLRKVERLSRLENERGSFFRFCSLISIDGFPQEKSVIDDISWLSSSYSRHSNFKVNVLVKFLPCHGSNYLRNRFFRLLFSFASELIHIYFSV